MIEYFVRDENRMKIKDEKIEGKKRKKKKKEKYSNEVKEGHRMKEGIVFAVK